MGWANKNYFVILQNSQEWYLVFWVIEGGGGYANMLLV